MNTVPQRCLPIGDEEIDKSNLLEGSLKVINGENMREVYILPKKPAKLGFFEKMFHLFS